MRFSVLRTLAVGFASTTLAVSLGISHDATTNSASLTLPYGTWKSSYDSETDIYTFKNIRFGQDAGGNNRWSPPVTPAKSTEVFDGSYGPQCIQYANIAPNVPQSEDCLFLTVQVPGKAIRSPSTNKLPVLNWFFGGGYILGSKDIYDGTGLMGVADNEIIFVASNYRLGGFGFLAGTQMEQLATPNVAFYDQRAVLQWIQDFISLVGGDKSRVTAMGESAGGGSILHHLVAFGGKQDPLFRSAIMQSTAYEPLWDRRGQLSALFDVFASYCGCGSNDIGCMRSAPLSKLINANVQTSKIVPSGAFAFGPSDDGRWVRQLAPLELKTGNFWKNLTALMVTHVANEAALFVPQDIKTNADFDNFVDGIIPTYAVNSGIGKLVKKHYNSTNGRTNMQNLVDESSFTCNSRRVIDAFASHVPTYAMSFDAPPGFHGFDLASTFAYKGSPSGTLGQAWQSYLVSLVRTGNPNTFRIKTGCPATIEMPLVNDKSNALSNTIHATGPQFVLGSDQTDTESKCLFWDELDAALVNLGGYAPPGAVVSQSLAKQTGSPSANYKTPALP